MNLKEFYKSKKTTLYIGVFIAILVVIIFGCILFPSVFYDQWIWKYYWGPVVADATSGTAWHNGVRANEGYTIISEITYGIILIIALYFIYKLLKKLEIKVDWRFALALMPYILFGSISRTLEDTGYFGEPFVYWFISPLIYFQIAAYALFFLLLGYYLEKKYKNPRITVNNILFSGGLICLIPSLVLIALWLLGYRWGDTSGISFNVFSIVIGISSLVVGLVYLIARRYKSNEKIAVYANPLNLSMLVGHLIDGLTSYISIKDPFNFDLHYAEKHPASNVLLNIWGPLFPITKFILIIVVVYVFDVLYKDELRNYVTLVNLLKIGIIILGFSPGLRDLLRVTMGV
ncbi:MAG: DUF63 family protein [Candidatus Thermoplasmatota archaeon]|jgi:uncharacterized membrane protein|nr:DUF63 family protein [Candidatus Thermoplasmatota archaeon]